MNSSNLIIAVLISVLTLSACGSTKKTTSAPDVDASEMKARELLSNVEQSEFNYKYLSAKTEIDYKTADKSQSVKADLRMQKDSAIWLSITPFLNIEAFRVLITPDSIHILDRLNKVYYQRPFSYIKEFTKVDLTFSMLQDIFSGGPIILEKGNIKADVENNKNVLISENEQLINKMYFEPADFLIRRTNMNDKNAARSIDIKYDSYSKVNTSMFSHVRNIDVKADEQATIGLEFSKVTLNNTLSFPFIVGDNYEVVK